MRTWVWLLVGLLLLSGCGSQETPGVPPPPEGTLRIATATRAGVYYPVGEAMATLWGRQIPDAKPAVLLTAGSPENIQLLLKREAEVAFAQSGVVYGEATEPGSSLRETLRGLTHLYPNVMQLVVRTDSGITDPAGLKGKRFVPGAIGSATLINAEELLALYGLTLSDMEVQHMGYAEAAEALVSGKVDAALIAGGLPTEAVRSMLEAGTARLLNLEPPAVVRRYPWYYPYAIPQGTYPGQREDVRTVAVANILIARADMEEELAYQLVRSLYEGRGELLRAHPAADIKIEHALRGITGVLPLHPGAARYFKKVGVLP
ncbi:MAG: TAXI family TRAP transporter solute-binding subunit [Bacillota bacterium]